MPGKSNNMGSLGNTTERGKAANLRYAQENRNRQPTKLEVESVEVKKDKFVFKIKGKAMMTVTAGKGIKKKIYEKICTPVPVPENSL